MYTMRIYTYIVNTKFFLADKKQIFKYQLVIIDQDIFI